MNNNKLMVNNNKKVLTKHVDTDILQLLIKRRLGLVHVMG